MSLHRTPSGNLGSQHMGEALLLKVLDQLRKTSVCKSEGKWKACSGWSPTLAHLSSLLVLSLQTHRTPCLWARISWVRNKLLCAKLLVKSELIFRLTVTTCMQTHEMGQGFSQFWKCSPGIQQQPVPSKNFRVHSY